MILDSKSTFGRTNTWHEMWSFSGQTEAGPDFTKAVIWFKQKNLTLTFSYQHTPTAIKLLTYSISVRVCCVSVQSCCAASVIAKLITARSHTDRCITTVTCNTTPLSELDTPHWGIYMFTSTIRNFKQVAEKTNNYKDSSIFQKNTSDHCIHLNHCAGVFILCVQRVHQTPAAR